jgi:catechol 2,3-dioxygenase-like lactoylglutathione lyase family enzyme
MKIRRIAHLCITSADLDSTVTFYRDILDFPIVFRFLRKGEVFGYYFRVAPDSFLECFLNHSTAREAGGIKHFCLETDDIDALEKHLQAKGVATRGRRMGADGSHQLWCTDPNGIDIEFQQYTGRSSQHTGEDCTVDW